MTSLENIIYKCREAIGAGVPVIFIESDDMGLIDEVLRTGKVVPYWYNTTEGWMRDDDHTRQPDNIYVCNNNLRNHKMFTGSWSHGYGPGGQPLSKTFLPDECEQRYLIPQVPGGVPFVIGVRNYGVAANGVPTEDNDRNIMNFISQRLSSLPGDGIRRCTLILQAPTVSLPNGSEPYVEVINVPPLSDDEIRDIILQFAREKGEHPYPRMLDSLTVDLRGFNLRKIIELLMRIRLTFSGVFHINAEGKSSDIIRQAKEQMLIKEGLLRLKKTSGESASGLERIKDWVESRAGLIMDSIGARDSWLLRAPKGILVSGIPGTGKSLLAKAVAQSLQLPLIQFDMGSVLGGVVGQSESNMRRVLRLAENMSPCVLWIDEIEKAFSSASASGNSDSGLGKRIFGQFLTWMQEKTVPCFIFATANDITALPPELLRRGRFDKKFFTFMPTKEECITIFRGIIQGSARNAADYFDPAICSGEFLDEVMRYCGKHGKFLTGADIEGIVEDAKFIIYRAFKGIRPNGPVYTRDLFRKALFQAIDEVQSYGETDMDRIADCLIRLAKNQFAPASETNLINLRNVDTRRKTIPEYEGARNGYDELLYEAIRNELEQAHN